ncbi:unnamed protein product [Rotaria sp. Silwood2]|nr:unnamed protein product [Rotaria sp. Silwood2]CAF3937779.1 unnamed protein product [Rotaria sp. Silwood2]
MLEFIPRFHGLIYTRLLNTEWHRLKLADHEQMQRKVDQACNSIKLLIENIIEETRGIWNLIMAILTVTMLCPWHTTLSFILVYKAFFLGYVRQHGGELLKLRTESNKTSEQLHQRHSLVAGRILDYVLHCEQTAMITNTASFKVALERLWYTVDYAANRLSFVEELLEKTCTLIVISVVLIHTTNTPLMVIPNFDGQLDRPVENQLSGGQKTRLMLARALNRAQQRQSRILILDEPDQGLPSETTFRIMPNIVRWFKSKGILFLTLHNDRVRKRLFVDHLLHIDHGHIQSIPFDHHRSRDPLFDFNLSQTNIN